MYNLHQLLDYYCNKNTIISCNFLTHQNKSKVKVTSSVGIWHHNRSKMADQRNLFTQSDPPGDVTVDARGHNMHYNPRDYRRCLWFCITLWFSLYIQVL